MYEALTFTVWARGPTFWIGSIHDETHAMKIHAIKTKAKKTLQ